MVKRMAKAVRWGVMGFGAPSSGDMGAPAEWLSGGAGYAGVKRWRKENRFLSRHCRTLAKAKGGAAWRFAGYQGCVWDGVTQGYGWDGGARYQGFVGLAGLGWSFLET